MYQNLPDEMKSYRQFVVWRYEEDDGTKPTKVPYNPHNGWPAKVNDSNTWGTFDQCLALLNEGANYSGMGFVLTESDPFAFIDLDDTKGDDAAVQAQMRIYESFPSYSEISPSGNGLHIIVKGCVPSGRKRSKVEVYSDLRFMTVTGNVYRNEAIRDHNELLNKLWAEMGKNVQACGIDPKAPQTHTDEEVIAMCLNAANGEKAADLASGEWQKYYTSQSEADLALVNIISFYTQNRDQIIRLFKASALGARNKQTTVRGVDYLNYMINKSFDRLLPPIDLEGLQNNLREAIENRIREQNKTVETPVSKREVADGIKNSEDIATYLTANRKSVYRFPPGLVGEIAQYILEQAPRPVPEIALGGALALMAGIAGRAYNISGTGLNMFVMVLAGTGRGKEAIATGIDRLMTRVSKKVPSANEFIGPAEISSPQALVKYMNKVPSFVSIVGEFGLKLQQMSSARATPIEVGLRRMMLDLYTKSGEGKIVRPTIYSNIEKNTEELKSPAFTLMGESTPERFYQALSEQMVAEGLVPRFFCIEYLGERPPLNENHVNVQPSEDLIEKVATICSNAQMLNSQHKANCVDVDYEAAQLLKDFDKYCDEQINKAGRDVQAQLWNRAHLKVLRLSALVSVGINPWHPTVTADVVEWAMSLVVADVRNILDKFKNGEISSDDDEGKQLAVLVTVFRDYVTKRRPELAGYKKIPANLHESKVLPYSYIYARCVGVAVFKNDRFGASKALDRALRSLIDIGAIQQLGRTQCAALNTTAKCYMIQIPDMFGI